MTTVKRTTSNVTNANATKRDEGVTSPIGALDFASARDVPDDVWGLIARAVASNAFGPLVREITKISRDGEKRIEYVDRHREVYKQRAMCLLAMGEVNAQLRRVMASAVGDECFALTLDRERSAYCNELLGVEKAPREMTNRQKCFLAYTRGCQGCARSPTMRKPNWVFGVRMCAGEFGCLQQRTVLDRDLAEDASVSVQAWEGLPSELVFGEDYYNRGAIVGRRYWRASVMNRMYELERERQSSLLGKGQGVKTREERKRRWKSCETTEERLAERRGTIDSILYPKYVVSLEALRASATYKKCISRDQFMNSENSFSRFNVVRILNELPDDFVRPGLKKDARGLWYVE